MKKKVPQLLILLGLSKAENSAFAKDHLENKKKWIRISEDDFRSMQFCKHPNKNLALTLSMVVDASIKAALDKGSNVLLEVSHFNEEYLNHYITIFNNKADISFKLLDFDKTKLNKKISSKLVKDYKSLKQNFDFSTRKKIEVPDNDIMKQNKKLPKAIICDIDGTLALMNGRNPFDASTADQDLPNWSVINMVNNYKKLGYSILLLTGREDRYREVTLKFLKKYKIKFDKLLMRKTKDNRKDSIIKKEIFESEISGRYYIELVLDDRNQVVDLWRKELKLPCFQVRYGDF